LPIAVCGEDRILAPMDNATRAAHQRSHQQMSRRPPHPRLAVLGAVLACAAAAPAAGASGWTIPSGPLAAAANGPSGAVVALDPAGDGIAAWTGDDGAGIQSLVVRTRPAGGVWSDPVTLVRDVAVDAPAVAIDGAGTATVVWIESADGSTFAARATRRDAASGSWDLTPHAFAAQGIADPLTHVRTDAAGHAIAAWVEHDPGTGVAFVRAAVADPAGGWTAPATLSDPDDASVAYGRPQVAADPSGGALVGWSAQRLASPFDSAIQTSTRSGDGGWSAPADLVTTSEAIGPPRLVGLDGGDVAATWFQGSPATLWGALRSGSGWAVEAVSADVAPACQPVQALGADAGGGATVVWHAGSSDGLDSVRLTAAGWEPRVPVFASLTESVEDAALDRGTVVLVAHDVAGNADSVLASRRQSDGTWSRPPVLLGAAPSSTSLSGADFATDPRGDALASWTATDALGAKAVWAAPYDVDHPAGGTPPPATSPSPQSSPSSGGGPAPAPPAAALLRPRVGGTRHGVLVLRRGSRTLKLIVRNRDAVTLRGNATLVRPRSGRRRALTLATRHGLALPGGRRATVVLRLSDAALRALRRASGFRLPVRLALTLRAADGRRTSARLTATLDASARFGIGRTGMPSGRRAC
jgi:hypothetical protein